jgi:hypothetical protein
MASERDMARRQTPGEASPYERQFDCAMDVLNDQERRIRSLADALPAEVVAELLCEVAMAREEILDGAFA